MTKRYNENAYHGKVLFNPSQHHFFIQKNNLLTETLHCIAKCKSDFCRKAPEVGLKSMFVKLVSHKLKPDLKVHPYAISFTFISVVPTFPQRSSPQDISHTA